MPKYKVLISPNSILNKEKVMEKQTYIGVKRVVIFVLVPEKAYMLKLLGVH